MTHLLLIFQHFVQEFAQIDGVIELWKLHNSWIRSKSEIVKNDFLKYSKFD